MLEASDFISAVRQYFYFGIPPYFVLKFERYQIVICLNIHCIYSPIVTKICGYYQVKEKASLFLCFLCAVSRSRRSSRAGLSLWCRFVRGPFGVASSLLSVSSLGCFAVSLSVSSPEAHSLSTNKNFVFFLRCCSALLRGSVSVPPFESSSLPCSVPPFRSLRTARASLSICVVFFSPRPRLAVAPCLVPRHYALWSRSRWFVFSQVAFPCFCCRFFSLVFSLRSLFNGSRVCALLSFLFSPFAVLALVAPPLVPASFPRSPFRVFLRAVSVSRGFASRFRLAGARSSAELVKRRTPPKIGGVASTMNIQAKKEVLC